MNSRILILSFVIITIFTVSLTENLQLADGVLQSAKRLVYDIEIGETQSQFWTLVNNEDSPILLEIFATGPGSELLEFLDTAYLEPTKKIKLEVFAVIPPDHPDNIEYHPNLYALKKGIAEDGSTGVVVNVRMKTIPFIKIGENPIYTPPPEIKIATIPKEDTKPKVVEPIKDTLEERLAKMKALNEANKKEEPIIMKAHTPEPKCGAGTILVDGICKIVVDSEPVAKECNWFEIFLSWFGFGKC